MAPVPDHLRALFPTISEHERRIFIAGVDADTTFYMLDIEGCKFSLPPDDLLITETPSLHGDSTMSTDEWTQWGTDDLLVVSALCFECFSARPDPETGRTAHLMLKMVLHFANEDTNEGFEKVGAMVKEATFYATHLSSLQGNHIPVHYGMWAADTVWGGVAVCTILEYAGVPFKLRGPYDTSEHRAAFASLVTDLHHCGMRHGQLLWPFIARHFLWDATKEIPRVVDFTLTSFHYDCPRLLPLTWYNSSPTQLIRCGELIDVGLYLELFGGKPVADDEEVQKALKVLQDYEEKNKGMASYSAEEALQFQREWLQQHRHYAGT